MTEKEYREEVVRKLGHISQALWAIFGLALGFVLSGGWAR